MGCSVFFPIISLQGEKSSCVEQKRTLASKVPTHQSLRRGGGVGGVGRRPWPSPEGGRRPSPPAPRTLLAVWKSEKAFLPSRFANCCSILVGPSSLVFPVGLTCPFCTGFPAQHSANYPALARPSPPQPAFSRRLHSCACAITWILPLTKT